MRRRVVWMAVIAVTIAILMVGAPLAAFGSLQQWESAQQSLNARVSLLERTIERRLAQGDSLDEAMLGPFLGGTLNPEAQILVITPDGERLRVGDIGPSKVVASSKTTVSGANITMEVRVGDVMQGIYVTITLVAVASIFAFIVAVMFALKMSRRIAAPLIYLAAAAEQVGSGQTRPRVKPSGIEEIDLVQSELVRSADRMAGRLAAERQFASDATHQLRTPLAALSMRLEEIELISTEDEVKQEASAALNQIDRLTGVVDDLLQNSRKSSGGTTEAVDLDQVFAQQLDEWSATFDAAKRGLEFSNEANRVVLASPGALAQVLATLIENSLKYGAGTTRIATRASSGRGVFIDVSDEGEGVAEDLVANLFERGVSGKGSTGVGLALAKDLVAADGGRLELTQRTPPIFTVFLNGLPSTLDPRVVMPQGALVAVGRRRSRR